MARPWFKRAWTRIVPEPAERSTYVLFSSVALMALFAFWQPLGGTVWNIGNPAIRMLMYLLFGLGFLIVLIATFLINHFDLFGLRQVYLAWRGKPYTHIGFHARLLYRLVRHPLMLGFLIAFWGAPTMTAGHLLFSTAMTVYILIATQLEERNLVAALGDQYRDYQSDVSMLVPLKHLPRRHTTETVGQN